MDASCLWSLLPVGLHMLIREGCSDQVFADPVAQDNNKGDNVQIWRHPRQMGRLRPFLTNFPQFHYILCKTKTQHFLVSLQFLREFNVSSYPSFFVVFPCFCLPLLLNLQKSPSIKTFREGVGTNIDRNIRKFPIKVHRGRGQNFPMFISCLYRVELAPRQLGLPVANQIRKEWWFPESWFDKPLTPWSTKEAKPSF